ncbi:MAG: precorrin-8X methylmutase [Treponema sp.]|jgi:precorrin-8X/cobalt-precorrin-8 methylmutase|nr:precorrin-8X methylmutase [Treponema sp.]
MNWQVVKPAEIEAKSFEIIAHTLQRQKFSDSLRSLKTHGGVEIMPLLLRIIHTTADFSMVKNLSLSYGAITQGIDSLRTGATIVTDTEMIKAGIDKTRLASWGGRCVCFMTDPEVVENAKKNNTTRAYAAMDKAVSLSKPLIFAIGNAPTALGHLCELVSCRAVQPSLIIGVPVGFVNVIESKEMLESTGVPFITIRGRKGGSTVAVSICNALLRLAAAGA